MEISFDPAKRELTLRERGLDFADAWKLFEGKVETMAIDRSEYEEERFVSYGRIDELAIVLVWTERDGTRRIISMRRAHAKEMQRAGMD